MKKIVALTFCLAHGLLRGAERNASVILLAGERLVAVPVQDYLVYVPEDKRVQAQAALNAKLCGCASVAQPRLPLSVFGKVLCIGTTSFCAVWGAWTTYAIMKQKQD